MNRFTEAAIYVTILALLSNVFLIHHDISELNNLSFLVLFYSVSSKVFNILLFIGLLISKLVFRKAANYLFFCVLSYILIFNLATSLKSILMLYSNDTTFEKQYLLKNVWLFISINVLWLGMYLLLYSRFKILKKDEPVYFTNKNETPARLHLIQHGIGFFILLIMLLFILFVNWPKDYTTFVTSPTFLINLTFILLICITLVQIYRQKIAFYFFAVSIYTYMAIVSVISFTASLIFAEAPISLIKAAELSIVYLCMAAYCAVLIWQALSFYRKINVKPDEI